MGFRVLILEITYRILIKNSVWNLHYIWLLGTELLYRLVNQFVNNISATLKERKYSVRCPRDPKLVGIPDQKLQFTSSRALSLRSHFILSRTLNVVLPNRLFPSRFATKIFCFYHFANSCYGHHLLVTYFMTLILV